MIEGEGLMQKNVVEGRTVIFEELEEKLKGVRLEDMSTQDVFDRYIGYGDDEELDRPEIQLLLIQNGFIEELTEMVDIITDKRVVKEVFASNLFIQNTNITFIWGKIENMKLVKDETVPDFAISLFEFVDKETSNNLLLKRKTNLFIRGYTKL